MITWILAQEPTEQIACAIEVIEARLGSEEDVNWICPVAEPIQD